MRSCPLLGVDSTPFQPLVHDGPSQSQSAPLQALNRQSARCHRHQSPLRVGPFTGRFLTTHIPIFCGARHPAHHLRVGEVSHIDHNDVELLDCAARWCELHARSTKAIQFSKQSCTVQNQCLTFLLPSPQTLYEPSWRIVEKRSPVHDVERHLLGWQSKRAVVISGLAQEDSPM